MLKKHIHALRVLPLLLCLTACANTTPPLPIPSNMILCQEAPEVPTSPTDKQLALFILELSDAGQECREKLLAIKAIEEEKNYVGH